ncbi:hypothetical protein [Desulfitobacterium sp.]|uniref:hypothetical protein n=1 Tax=Desulfitobacterium sp. TaxID=49981 RepID=UPI002B208C36|nr:hypothetical protein [Desulfitobacterium sp.]MEA4902794.1 hypothetical protein [Desulfitobacterium sp.]
MNNIILGPLNYFKNQSYIKGSLWLIIIGIALNIDIFLVLFIWIFAGWLGGRKGKVKAEPANLETPNEETIMEQAADQELIESDKVECNKDKEEIIDK